jgi:hypothetical protein
VRESWIDMWAVSSRIRELFEAHDDVRKVKETDIDRERRRLQTDSLDNGSIVKTSTAAWVRHLLQHRGYFLLLCIFLIQAT